MLPCLVGLSRYEWMVPADRDRRRKQQAFFAALFLYIGRMLPPARQCRNDVGDMLRSLHHALDLSPFHSDMANRLIALGSLRPALAADFLAYFGDLVDEDCECAEILIEILYDLAALPSLRHKLSANLAQSAGRRLGFTDLALTVIARRTSCSLRFIDIDSAAQQRPGLALAGLLPAPVPAARLSTVM